MKGLLLIHPQKYSDGDVIINFDVLIERTWFNRLRKGRILKIIDKATSYFAPYSYVEKVMNERKERYWHLGSDDLNHCNPEYNNIVIDGLIALKLEPMVMYGC